MRPFLLGLRPALPFLPPVVWMGVIATLSGELLSSEVTGSRLLPLLAWLLPAASPATLHGLHAVVRKLGHLVEYGILGALWLRALAPGGATRRATASAIALAVAYAVADEARQGLAPSRSPAVLDVLIDAIGAFLGVGAVRGPGALAAAGLRLTRWAGWLVALASLAAAAGEWSLGLRAWDLAAAALAAGVVAWRLGALERRWRAAPRSPGDSRNSDSGV